MTRTALIGLSLLLTGAAAPSAIAGEQTANNKTTAPANIELRITDIEAQKGKILAALFDSEASYNGGKAINGAAVKVGGDTVTISFNDLKNGAYAIKLIHDVNDDGKLGTNLFGIPNEPYAFSNNAGGKFGPAKWADAKFIVSGHTVQSITLN